MWTMLVDSRGLWCVLPEELGSVPVGSVAVAVPSVFPGQDCFFISFEGDPDYVTVSFLVSQAGDMTIPGYYGRPVVPPVSASALAVRAYCPAQFGKVREALLATLSA